MTGGAGFIGSAVVRLAVSRGHSVINVDALTYAACLENIADASKDPNYFFEHSDIRNREELDAIFEKYDPEAVIHLAAESHVDRSIDDPSNFIETNVLGYWKQHVAIGKPVANLTHSVFIMSAPMRFLVASQSIPQLNSQKICPIVQEALTQPQKQVLTISFVLGTRPIACPLC